MIVYTGELTAEDVQAVERVRTNGERHVCQIRVCDCGVELRYGRDSGNVYPFRARPQDQQPVSQSPFARYLHYHRLSHHLGPGGEITFPIIDR